jgi:hypothetical protein
LLLFDGKRDTHHRRASVRLSTVLDDSEPTRDPFVAGNTHLPTFVSGMVYQYDYGPPSSQQELLERERTVWDFIDDPSETNASFLCTEGISWLWIDKQRTEQRSWEPFASPVIENDEVILARVDESQCP